MRKTSLPFIIIALSGIIFPQEKHSPDALMLRLPDISQNKIVFQYAGDLYTVPKTGGTATGLTTIPGSENFAKFSPKGDKIVFSGNYDGNVDLYVIPAEGGVPTRLTHSPAPDLVNDWYPMVPPSSTARSRTHLHTATINSGNSLLKVECLNCCHSLTVSLRR